MEMRYYSWLADLYYAIKDRDESAIVELMKDERFHCTGRRYVYDSKGNKVGVIMYIEHEESDSMEILVVNTDSTYVVLEDDDGIYATAGWEEHIAHIHERFLEGRE